MFSFTHNLNIISRCTKMERGAALKEYGLCGGQAMYLFRLCHEPGLSQDELARRLYVNKSNVARQVARLEQQGYVIRKSSQEDKRVQLVYPTEKAIELLPFLQGMVRNWNQYLLEGLIEKISQRARDYIEKEVGW